MILPPAHGWVATPVLQWELFHYDSQFSTFLPQISVVTFEHYMCKRNVERAIQHYKIYKRFQRGT